MLKNIKQIAVICHIAKNTVLLYKIYLGMPYL